MDISKGNTQANRKEPKMSNCNEINRATAKAYIHDYITNGPDTNADEWDMDYAADNLVEYVEEHNLDTYDDVPEDEFTDIVFDAYRH